MNSELAVYNVQNLGLEESVNLVAFSDVFGSFFTPGSVYDPQIQFDPVSNRWYFVAVAEGVGEGRFKTGLMYGFSKTSDPRPLRGTPNGTLGGWCQNFIETSVSLNQGGNVIGLLFEDFPKLGHSDDAIVFGTNSWDYDPATGLIGEFVSAKIWRFPKPLSGALEQNGICPNDATSGGWSTASEAIPCGRRMGTWPLPPCRRTPSIAPIKPTWRGPISRVPDQRTRS